MRYRYIRGMIKGMQCIDYTDVDEHHYRREEQRICNKEGNKGG